MIIKFFTHLIIKNLSKIQTISHVTPIHDVSYKCKYGAIDIYIYNQQVELKRIVSEIYGKKLP